MFPEPIQKATFFSRGSYRIVLYFAIIVWLLPLAAVFLTSFRSLADINSGNYWGWPTEFALVENYTQVFTVTPMIQYFLNSLVITIPTVLGTLLLSSLAGYSLAKHRFRGNFLIFALFIAGNFVPAQILMIPVRNLTLSLGVYDTKMGLILFHTAFQTGFCTFFLRGFIKELPHEIVESARKMKSYAYASDDPEISDFAHPSVINIADTLQVAISTGGSSPAMARKIKIKIESFLKKNISNDDILQIKLQKFARLEAKQVLSTQLDRKKFLYAVMNDKHVKGLLKEGKYKIAQTKVKKILREWI